MMLCPTCGYQIDQYNLDRCPNCGNALPTQATHPPSDYPPGHTSPYPPSAPQASQSGAEPQLPDYSPSGSPPSAPAPYGGYAPPSAPRAPGSPPPGSPQRPPPPPKRGLQWWHWLLIAGGGLLALTCVLCGSLYTLGLLASNAPPPSSSSYSNTTPGAFPSPTPTADRTVATGTFSVSGSASDFITQGESYSYASSKGDVLTISASSTGSTVYIRVTGSNADDWTLVFQAPGAVAPINGKPAVLVPGTYTDAHDMPSSGNGPVLSLSGNSRTCDTVTGSFTIIDAVFGPPGYVQQFDATFVQHCDGSTAATSGEVHLSKPPPG